MQKASSEAHPETAFEIACEAEPKLRYVARLVDALCELARPDDRLCASCVWELILKPLTEPWVGHERGYLPTEAVRKEPGESWESVDLTSLLREPDAPKLEASTDLEKWMRTSEAFDAFTDVLLARLDAADPGNGHGICRGDHTS